MACRWDFSIPSPQSEALFCRWRSIRWVLFLLRRSRREAKVLNFLACPFDALGSTMATYGAQNVGASKYERLNKGLYSASLMGCGYSLLAFAIAWFFGRSLIGLFVSGDSSAQLIELARDTYVDQRLAYPLLTLVNVVRFMIHGHGFLDVCDSGGRYGDDCTQSGGHVPRSGTGLRRARRWQPAGMGCGGYFPRAGVFPLPPRIDESGTSPACDDEGKRRLRLP